MEECIEFGDPTLRAVLHTPETPSGTGIILLHGWTGYRTGPHGMFVKAARELAASGCVALRLDLRGRGNSDGQKFATDIDMKIEDTLCAMRVLRERCGLRSLYLLGLCSGGNVALGAASLDKTVAGLVLWSTPLFAPYKTKRQEAKRKVDVLRDYAAKLCRRETYSKLFRGQLHIGVILGRLRKKKPPRDLRDSRRDVMKELRGYRGRVLLIYGTKDDESEGAPEFYREFFTREGSPPQVHFVEGANHSFYSLAWEREVIQRTREWLVAGGRA